jgi:hypothetical protein
LVEVTWLKRLWFETLGSKFIDPSDLLLGPSSDADPLAITPETTGAALIAIDVAVTTDGDRAARPYGDGAAGPNASGAIDAPEATVGASL